MDDSDTVHLIASNVRPSEVARTLGHEIIGHKGLRTVFGENFDALLDQVYKDHFEEVSLLAQRYHRDTETLENQRYLTEEFPADQAAQYIGLIHASGAGRSLLLLITSNGIFCQIYYNGIYENNFINASAKNDRPYSRG
ncbi:MAG: hypothetical protein E7043_04965 [Lentisphaerae bacterium]|nr:hypothetical protein [Lentisphaerota bacterium]